MINTAQLLARVDLADLVRRHGVELRKQGTELVACCPFHNENTPSFHVAEKKGFVHCFGCGVHYDAIGFLMAMDGYTFVEACRKLGGQDLGEVTRKAVREVRQRVNDKPIELWVPIYPVPDEAPAWAPGVSGRVWNPKREPREPGGTPGGWWTIDPVRADAYRAGDGSLMGYVLRTEIDGKKITPTITWCIGPRGEARWCLQPFPEPRPLYGLDQLAARPEAPVLMPQGEKCAARAAEALPMYVAMTWCGGDKGVRLTDFSPLEGRDLVLWPDADPGGIGGMLGYVDGSGLLHEGAAQLAHRAGVRSIRVVDVEGMPKGWDLADALDDGWTPRQLAAWAKSRVKAVEVQATERPAA
ncbi:MAG TPA: CHC2 zinc finger domain-containing protein [Frateuria sp.]|uniref:CHC2 zinc finger domain-containing protein n=1 Tax=Frateuria sp. TaxID=2211372 RepID=UPI002D7FE4E3|nr:CHC2 zinc finger domain-containing protein [Frateuria sp.]HET6807208.1 CHC2 zinc finger domain-containing protein [Frateuria sp.]